MKNDENSQSSFRLRRFRRHRCSRLVESSPLPYHHFHLFISFYSISFSDKIVSSFFKFLLRKTMALLEGTESIQHTHIHKKEKKLFGNIRSRQALKSIAVTSVIMATTGIIKTVKTKRKRKALELYIFTESSFERHYPRDHSINDIGMDRK